MAKKRILLHTCCAPCAVHIAETLKNEYDVSLFFHNPQIFPAEEYAKRLLETKKIRKILGLDVIEGNRDYDSWLAVVQGYEKEPEAGKRCLKCFEFNLKGTAEYAKMHGFDVFTTTLTISPHKNSRIINEIGRNLSKEHNIEFLEENFKKNDGFLKSIQKCKQHNIYRQNYCGCVYSLKSSIPSPNE